MQPRSFRRPHTTDSAHLHCGQWQKESVQDTDRQDQPAGDHGHDDNGAAKRLEVAQRLCNGPEAAELGPGGERTPACVDDASWLRGEKTSHDARMCEARTNSQTR